MKTSVEKLNETRVKLIVNVPFSELDQEIDQAYKAIGAQVTIPGFRKGKAPRQLIDARFGRGPILEQVINDMLPGKYQAAVEENELVVLTQPQIEVSNIEDNDFVEFTAEVETRPEINVPDFSQFSITVPALKVSDQDVEAELNKLRERFGELKDSDHELGDGAFAVLNIRAEIDGEEVEESSSEGLSYQLGDDSLIPGLDDALRGHRTGDDVEFNATIEAGERSGEEATFKVHVVQTKERTLPELDDEFAQMASEYDTMQELREATVSQLKDSKKNQQAADIRDEVMKLALAEVTFALPEEVVEQQVHSIIHQILGQMAHDESLLARLLEAQGTTREEFDQKNREQAEESVRTQLFLDAVADERNPEISQAELTEHIVFTAQSYGMDPGEFVTQVQEANQMANLFADLRRGKALANAIVEVTVTDDEGNSVDPKDYFGEDEEPENNGEDAEDTENIEN